MSKAGLWIVCAAAVLAGCRAVAGPVTTAEAADYADLGSFHREVTTRDPAAQRWFDRGLVLCYGFNHEEAIRCFERAAEADPDCAMAWWGMAAAAGPNINNTAMDAAANELAWKAASRAVELAAAQGEGLSAVERDLIAALAQRYVSSPPEDRSALDRAWADSLRAVRGRHPDDPDVAALAAEALMILRPWNQWSKEGVPAPETPEIVAVLEGGLERWPEHPALCHFYIHTMEASPDPSVALPAADRLRDMVPDAGHLVHMPSHIDVLVGHYQQAIEANQRAIAADARYVAREGRDNFYTLYRVHNYHFLVYAAMFSGQSEMALRAAQELIEEIPADLLTEWADYLEAFVATPIHVLVRFGRWDDVLALPEPAPELVFTRAIRHYARGLAHSAQGRTGEAEEELQALRRTAAEVPPTRILFNNTCADILGVAEAMVAGELEYRRGQFDRAFAHLRDAVRRDDALNYDEPWSWMQPARHALGALLLEQERFEEAESVFRADLKRHPENGWALLGLAECMRARGAEAQARDVDARIAKVWEKADVPLTVSCYCRLGT